MVSIVKNVGKKELDKLMFVDLTINVN